MRRCICLALVFCLLGVCGTGAAQELPSLLGPYAMLAQSGVDYSQYGVGNIEPYEERLTINVGLATEGNMYWPEGESLEDNIWKRTYAEKLNIDLNLEINTAANTEKVNMLIATGDIPDILIVNQTQLGMLADSGLIRTDVQQVWDAYAGAQIRRLVAGIGEEEIFAQCSYDGKMIAIPYPAYSRVEASNVLYLRTDWMEKLGLEDPTCYADLIKIMEAFVTQDPDGNGVDDTYGLPLTRSMFLNVYNVEGFLNIFGGHALENFWVDDPENPGKVALGAFQPEVKEALAELNRLYGLGYIHPEFAAMDANAANQLIASGKCGMQIGIVWCLSTIAGGIYSSVQNDPEADWHAAAIPGLDASETKVSANYYSNGSYAVFNKDFEHPEALLKMINLAYDVCYAQGSGYETYQTYVERADSYRPFAIYKGITNYFPLNKNQISAALINQGVAIDEMPPYAVPFATWIEEYEESGERTLWYWQRFFGENSGHLVLAQYIKNDLALGNRWYGPNTPTMQANMSLINDLVHEMLVKLIMGEEEIDAFEAYKQQADSLGLSAITKEVNDWLAANK